MNFGHGMVTSLETEMGNGHKTIPLGFLIKIMFYDILKHKVLSK